jgi:hypothetical protein
MQALRADCSRQGARDGLSYNRRKRSVRSSTTFRRGAPLRQRRAEVVLEVLDVLDADGQTDQPVIDAARQA